jgi:sugar phosphate isomerase/epimerase
MNPVTESPSGGITRRQFVGGALATAALSSLPAAPAKAPRRPVAFNTANLVARVTGYRFELKRWGEQAKKTVAATDEKEWAAICRDIAAAGYRAVEVWVAHADPATLTDARAKVWRQILADHGLQPVGLGGTLNEGTARVCQQLGIPACNGGLGGANRLEAIRRLSAATGLHYNFENHPEKTVEEIVAKIEGGNDKIGVVVDTGWLGTQGLDAPATIRRLGPLVRHVHVKDVKHAGAHETCPLGEGVVNIAATIRALKDIGYAGWYSWEDEPEDRNPLDIARAMRERIEGWLA